MMNNLEYVQSQHKNRIRILQFEFPPILQLKANNFVTFDLKSQIILKKQGE